MTKGKLLGVQWVARSYLTDVELMDKDVEATYFRLLNYIYLTQDRLPDDDGKLWKLAKCRSRREYLKHKAELLAPRGKDPETGEDIPPRLYIECGFIRSGKCSEQLGTASRLRHAKSKAGKASAKAAKSQKDKKTGATAVSAESTTDASTNAQQNAKQEGQQTSQRNDPSVAHNLKEIPTVSLPLTPNSDLPPSGSGLGGPAVRPTETREQREAREAAIERKRMEADGSRFRVDPNGYVVCVEPSGAVNALHDLADDESAPDGNPLSWPLAPDGVSIGQKLTATPSAENKTGPAPKREFDPILDMPPPLQRAIFPERPLQRSPPANPEAA